MHTVTLNSRTSRVCWKKIIVLIGTIKHCVSLEKQNDHYHYSRWPCLCTHKKTHEPTENPVEIKKQCPLETSQCWQERKQIPSCGSITERAFKAGRIPLGI